MTNLPSPLSTDRSFGDPSVEFDYPDAVHPPREYHLDANGLKIAVHEWGDADAPPLLLVHGGFDFARTFDVFAPKLAAGGWRVVSWDQRGHGDSEHPELYSWDADMRDALTVFDHVSPGRPLPVVGHSKGGALMTQLADAQPFRFTHLVNMYGITETTVHVTYRPLRAADALQASSPIGVPIPDLYLLVLDENREPVPVWRSTKIRSSAREKSAVRSVWP